MMLDKKMEPINWPKIALYIGLFLFLISFMLPAYVVSSKLFYGYQCAYIAPAIAASGNMEGGILAQILTRIHYSFLGLHNVLLPLNLLLFKKKIDSNYPWVMNLFILSVFNTILFFFYNHFVLSVANEELRVGYYVWVLSGIIIMTVQIWKKRMDRSD
jgi:hypothetical protein